MAKTNLIARQRYIFLKQESKKSFYLHSFWRGVCRYSGGFICKKKGIEFRISRPRCESVGGFLLPCLKIYLLKINDLRKELKKVEKKFGKLFGSGVYLWYQFSKKEKKAYAAFTAVLSYANFIL